MKTADFAGIKVDNLTMAEAVAAVEGYFNSAAPKLIVTPNPELIVAAQKDEELKNIVNSADLRAPDGISMVVVSKILGFPLKERVSGIDLMLKIVELCGRLHKKIFLVGGRPGVAEEAAGNLAKQCPGINIVGTYHGYFNRKEQEKDEEEEKVITLIKNSRADILFAGLGAGCQEKWLNKHLADINVKIGMVIGGSLDVLSGRKKRAPKIFQILCLEWLYRLITEPKRWKRQLALPKFLWLMFFGQAV